MTGSAALLCRYARTDSAAPLALIRLLVRAPSHIGEAFGVIAVKRRIRLRIVRYSRRGTATSASGANVFVEPPRYPGKQQTAV